MRWRSILLAVLLAACLAAGFCPYPVTARPEPLTPEQKTLLCELGFDWPEDGSVLEKLAAFPGTSFDGPNFRLTVDAVVSDADYKWLAVTATPAGDAAAEDSLSDDCRLSLFITGGRSGGNGGSQMQHADGTVSYRMDYETDGTTGYLYLRSDLPPGTRPDRAFLKKNALKIDLTPRGGKPIVVNCGAITLANGVRMDRLRLESTWVKAEFSSSGGEPASQGTFKSAVSGLTAEITCRDGSTVQLPLCANLGSSQSQYSDGSSGRASYSFSHTLREPLDIDRVERITVNGTVVYQK